MFFQFNASAIYLEDTQALYRWTMHFIGEVLYQKLTLTSQCGNDF